jgi:16S rRNA (cytosine967-C5)-methyltransferase
MRRLALLGLFEVYGIDALPGLSDEETDWLHRYAQLDRNHLPPAKRLSMPQWLLDKLSAQYGEEEAYKLADALNQPAPLDLRVNTMKANREDVIAELATAPIKAEPTPYAPLGLRIRNKPALQNLPLFKSGAIEVQDEGSQVLAQLLGARRGEMVVDFCAGAGGKTLAIGALMRNTGRLYAFDVSEKRLAKLKPRMARSGLSNVHPTVIAHERDAKIKRLAGKIDRVLVDAPCSGLGTLRRNPDVKWRQNPEGITEMHAKQAPSSTRRAPGEGRRPPGLRHLQPDGRRKRRRGAGIPRLARRFRAGADEPGAGRTAHPAGDGRLPEDAAASCTRPTASSPPCWSVRPRRRKRPRWKRPRWKRPTPTTP